MAKESSVIGHAGKLSIAAFHGLSVILLFCLMGLARFQAAGARPLTALHTSALEGEAGSRHLLDSCTGANVHIDGPVCYPPPSPPDPSVFIVKISHNCAGYRLTSLSLTAVGVAFQNGTLSASPLTSYGVQDCVIGSSYYNNNVGTCQVQQSAKYPGQFPKSWGGPTQLGALPLGAGTVYQIWYFDALRTKCDSDPPVTFQVAQATFVPETAGQAPGQTAGQAPASALYNAALVNTDIGADNSLYPGNPLGISPDPHCYSAGVQVGSPTECENLCTQIMDKAATMPGANPCVAVSYVSSNPPGQTLPPVGCCFPKWRKDSLGPTGARPGVDTYTAKYVRKAATDVSSDNLLSAEQGALGLFGPQFALAPECYNLGANVHDSSANACLSLCDTWNNLAQYTYPELGAPPCVAVSFVSSQPAETSLPPVGCCFPKMSTVSLGVVGTKPGVDTYVKQ